MSTIGNASLVLNATYGRMVTGLDSAYSKIQGWKGKVAGFMAGGFAGVAGGKLFGDALGSIKELADVGKRAKGIGAGSAEFMALGNAAETAGVKAEEFQNLLGKLQAKLGTAALGGEATQTLAQLGLKYDDLKGKRIDQQFLMISDSIAKVKDPTVAALLSTKLFEEQGVKLGPMLRRGSAELTAFIEKQKKLGVALSEQDMGKILAARNALPKVEAVFTGAWNKIVVAIAPMIESLATRLSDGMVRAQPFIDAVVGGLEAGFNVAGEALSMALGWLEGALNATGEWLGLSIESGDAYEFVQEVVHQIFYGIGAVAMIAAQLAKSVAAVGLEFASILIGPLQKFKNEIRTIIEVVKKTTLAGWVMPEAFDAVSDWVGETDFEAVSQNLENTAAGLWSGWDTLGGQMAAYDAWLTKAMRKKTEVEKPIAPKIDEPAPLKGDFLGGALLRGTQAEVSARLRFDAGGMTTMQQQQLAEAKNQTGLLNRSVAAQEKLAATLAPMGAI
jgi:hypothetical protein